MKNIIEKLKMHILPLIYAYMICCFLNWDCNITKWNFEDRFSLIIIYAFIWLINFLISCSNSFMKDESHIDDFDDK